MKTESTISIIHQELISTFAMLDTWFDEISDGEIHWEAIEVADHILSSNHHLLKRIQIGFEEALEDFQVTSEENQCIDQLRTSLRSQLHFCLYLLDELDVTQSDAENQWNEKQMGICDKLLSVTNHISHHLGR